MAIDIINSKEVLELFGNKISYRTLLSMVREKKIPACKVGKEYLFSKQVVLERMSSFLGL